MQCRRVRLCSRALANLCRAQMPMACKGGHLLTDEAAGVPANSLNMLACVCAGQNYMAANVWFCSTWTDSCPCGHSARDSVPPAAGRH